jgi:hypothetical protein
MRKHGVANFPDPDSKGRILITSGVDRNGHHTGVDTNAALFRTAQQACQKLQPNGGKPDPKAQQREVQRALKFSQCMRTHGVPRFPDPQVEGNGGMKMTIGKNSGVDPNSPRFKSAEKACQHLMGGDGPVQGGGPAESGVGPAGAP